MTELEQLKQELAAERQKREATEKACGVLWDALAYFEFNSHYAHKDFCMAHDALESVKSMGVRL